METIVGMDLDKERGARRYATGTMADFTPHDFESAMSLLTLAIAHIGRNRPETQCQSSRLAEQVCKIDAICAQSMRAIREDGK